MKPLNPNKFGVYAQCVRCGRRKKPYGRSVGAAAANGYCDSHCGGYNLPPFVGSLFPTESEADFGYPVSDIGTEIRQRTKDRRHDR